MTTRRELRTYALQFLFQQDLNPEELEPALEHLWADKSVTRKEREFSERLIRTVIAHRNDIDTELRRISDNWRVRRMPVLDRNLIRLAVGEMLYCDEIPPNVSINEAIELAKEFGGDETPAFVNGILDRVHRSSTPGAEAPDAAT